MRTGNIVIDNTRFKLILLLRAIIINHVYHEIALYVKAVVNHISKIFKLPRDFTG